MGTRSYAKAATAHCCLLLLFPSALLTLSLSLLSCFPPWSCISRRSFHPSVVQLGPRHLTAGISDPGNRLRKAQVLFRNEMLGPESLAFDPQGQGPYVGVADGRILRRCGAHWEAVAVASPSWNSSVCVLKPSKSSAAGSNPHLEHVCGRPLGLRLDPSSGDLFIADAYFGILRLRTRCWTCSSESKLRRNQQGAPDHEEAPPGAGMASSGGTMLGHSSCPAIYSGDDELSQGGQEEEQVKHHVPKAEVLASQVSGSPLVFANDVDVDLSAGRGGVVYFTETSTRFQRRDYLLGTMEGQPDGRLLKHDLSTGETTVLLDGLVFANGVALSQDKSFLAVCESTAMKCSKFWLKGPKEGSSEILAHLPGFPDNIRLNPRGRFWIAIHKRRNSFIDFLAARPQLRMALMKLLPSAEYIQHLSLKRHYAMALELDEDGMVTEVLEDKWGEAVRAISQVLEHDEKLWFGSVVNDHISVLQYEL